MYRSKSRFRSNSSFRFLWSSRTILQQQNDKLSSLVPGILNAEQKLRECPQYDQETELKELYIKCFLRAYPKADEESQKAIRQLLKTYYLKTLLTFMEKVDVTKMLDEETISEILETNTVSKDAKIKFLLHYQTMNIYCVHKRDYTKAFNHLVNTDVSLYYHASDPKQLFALINNYLEMFNQFLKDNDLDKCGECLERAQACYQLIQKDQNQELLLEKAKNELTLKSAEVTSSWNTAYTPKFFSKQSYDQLLYKVLTAKIRPFPAIFRGIVNDTRAVKTTNPVSLIHLAKLAEEGSFIQFSTEKLKSAQIADLYQSAKIYCRANATITEADKAFVENAVLKHEKATKTDKNSLFGKSKWLHMLKHYLSFHRNTAVELTDLGPRYTMNRNRM